MEKQPKDDRKSGDSNRGSRRGNPGLWIVAATLIVALFVALNMSAQTTFKLERYEFFLELIESGQVAQLELSERQAEGVLKKEITAPLVFDPQTGESKRQTDSNGNDIKFKRFVVRLPPKESQGQLADLLGKDMLRDGDKIQRNYAAPDNTGMWLYALALGLPLLVFLYLWSSFRRTRDQIMGGGFLSGFSKSPAKRFEATDKPILFKDVAGLVGVKEDLAEVVEFLKTPDKFRKLGGQVPKGILLNGPPGTGKTLLARAVAGEADVPFYTVNGSEFIQMFVGVGASRVRDLFQNAKENSPSIIFVDEIDAVGRQRGAGLGGGHDEREQTLNQILSEMDGFTPNDSTIVMAATNRPDVLDPALLRPGRFDRHVTVGRPTREGRVEIFKVHVREVPLADDVDLERLADSTIGLTGADIRNLVNEAALWAARNDKKSVDMEDFDYSRDKVLMGAKREEVLREGEKEKTAYHEAGHTLAAWRLEGGDRVHKVTIVPRGRSLGATQTMPVEDRLSISESELRDQLVLLMAGRAAEQIVYQETTVGAENDLERATSLARRMVTHWGMNDQLGPVSYKLSEEDPFLGREIHQQRQFSEHTMELIDGEVARTLQAASHRASELLNQHRDQLETITRALLSREELDESELIELIGPPVHGTGSPPSTAPNTDETVLQVDETVPQADETVPQADETVPQADETVPQADETVPQVDETVPQADETVPQADETAPQAD